MGDYKDLYVWQESIDFVEDVYSLLKFFPVEEKFALCDQLRRAVVSIASNIAEGSNRNTNKEFIQFLYIALGSASEVETQLIISKRLKYISSIDKELEKLTRIRKMLNSLIKSLKER